MQVHTLLGRVSATYAEAPKPSGNPKGPAPTRMSLPEQRALRPEYSTGEYPYPSAYPPAAEAYQTVWSVQPPSKVKVTL
jgi:hypothetical protein